jgi:hypothetical protein
MTNSELQEAGLLSTGDSNAGAPTYFDRVNQANAKILLDLSPARRTPELSRQPRQVYGCDLTKWNASMKLAEKDWVYITSIVQEHFTSGVMLKAITVQANRWLAAQRLFGGTHKLSTDEDIAGLDQMNEDNYRKTEVGEAAYGKDMSGNSIDRPNRNRKVVI